MSEDDQARSQLEALVSPLDHELLERLAQGDVTAETELRVGALMRRDYPAELVTAALGQHELRRRAQAKFTRAGRMYFTRAGLEQATAEVIARHRATRYAGAAQVADLCSGIGGDLIALTDGREVIAVDRDPLHLRMAGLNAHAYGVADAITPGHSDVRDVDLSGIDAVPAGWEVEFIADRRDLKEAALWSPALATASSRATILPEGNVLLPIPGDAVQCRDPGQFLLDPNPAVTRAGLVEDLARSLGTWKIDPLIAFLSSDQPLRTPFAHTLRVLDSGPWEQKALTPRLRALDVGSVDIRRRGLAGNVEDLHRQLKLHGTRRAALVMTRVNDRPWALICVDPDPASQDQVTPQGV